MKEDDSYAYVGCTHSHVNHCYTIVDDEKLVERGTNFEYVRMDSIAVERYMNRDFFTDKLRATIDNHRKSRSVIAHNLPEAKEVNSFDDIGRYLSRKTVRHIYASRGYPERGDNPKTHYECIQGEREYYNRLGNVIDSLDLIDYSCDTVCIRMSGNPATPYADPVVRLYCKKGLYEINDFTLTPIIYPEEYCGAKRRAQDEEMRKKIRTRSRCLANEL